MKITDKWFNLFKSNFFPVFPILKFRYSKKATTFEKKNVQNFGAFSDYSSVPNRRAGPNKRAGGKILGKK